MKFSEYLFIVFFFGAPGLLGGWFAHTRGKNRLFWAVVSALFPFCAFILWFQKPDHEIPGYFRKCKKCGGVYKWKQKNCLYCGAEHTNLAEVA